MAHTEEVSDRPEEPMDDDNVELNGLRDSLQTETPLEPAVGKQGVLLRLVRPDLDRRLALYEVTQTIPAGQPAEPEDDSTTPLGQPVLIGTFADTAAADLEGSSATVIDLDGYRRRGAAST